MTRNIETFLDEYLSERGLSRRHKNVRYIQFVETAQDIDEHLTNLLSGKVSAGFRIKNGIWNKRINGVNQTISSL